jgi:DNA-binding NarL/FixJ family response regulator
MDPEINSTLSHSSSFWRFFSDARLRAAADSAGGSARLGRVKILIVEDNLFLSMQMEEALSEADFEVVGKAASAEQALAFARQTHPDLMVVDIRLEGDVDGVSAATDIYNEMGIRSIFASSLRAVDVGKRGEAAKPLGWISKPFDMDALVALIRNSLAGKAQN